MSKQSDRIRTFGIYSKISYLEEKNANNQSAY